MGETTRVRVIEPQSDAPVGRLIRGLALDGAVRFTFFESGAPPAILSLTPTADTIRRSMDTIRR